MVEYDDVDRSPFVFCLNDVEYLCGVGSSLSFSIKQTDGEEANASSL